MSETDDFGALFKVGLQPKEGVSTIGVKVIKDGNADTAPEYQIDLKKKYFSKIIFSKIIF